MPSWSSFFPRFGPLEPWQRSQYLVILTVALARVGSDLTQPFIALYVRQLGVSDLAEASLWSGLVVGSAPLFSALMSPIWGSMADRFGRKAMVLRALTMISLLQMAQSFVPDVHWLLLTRTLLGAFAGFGTMAMALAVSLGPRERMGQAIGMVQAAELLPTAIGPTIGGMISDRFGLRTNFLATGLMLMIPVAVMFFLVREGDYAQQSERAQTPERARAKPARGWTAWRNHLAIPGFAAALAILFVGRFCDRSLPPILPLFLSELDTPPDQLATITGLVVSGGAIAAASSATLYGRRARPHNTRRLLMTALAGGALCSVLLALSTSWVVVLALRLVLGLLAGGTLSLGYTIGARLAPSERSGLTLGILASCAQLGGACAPLLGGLLGSVGLHLVFLVNAAAYLAALALMAFVARDQRPAVDPGHSSEPDPA
jgi:MFS transporter, DHA1 family, multidrug resistance protein